jgi:hypothetical protein
VLDPKWIGRDQEKDKEVIRGFKMIKEKIYSNI